MNEIDSDNSRKKLVESFYGAFKDALTINPDLMVNGPMTSSYGEIRLRNFVCIYSDNSSVDVLDIWFGRFGGRGGHPGEVQLAADVVEKVWVKHYGQQERFTNEELVQFCINRLREIESKG